MDIDHWILFNISNAWLSPFVCVYPLAQIARVWFRSQNGQNTVGGGDVSQLQHPQQSCVIGFWKIDFLSRQKTDMCIYFIPPWRLQASLPRRVEPGQSHYPFQKLLHSIFFSPLLLQSLSCLSNFFRSGFKASHSALLHCLLFILARRLAQALRKALTNSHSPFPPLCSVSTHCPYSCLSCTASIGEGLGKLNYFGHEVTGNQWGKISLTREE